MHCNLLFYNMWFFSEFLNQEFKHLRLVNLLYSLTKLYSSPDYTGHILTEPSYVISVLGLEQLQGGDFESTINDYTVNTHLHMHCPRKINDYSFTHSTNIY